MSNIDIDIKEGNPGAVGGRGRYAQHSFVAHMDFQIGSGLAGIHDSGNVAEDVHFHGGRYGIWTQRPSPGWQFTVVDAAFEGQREAAMRIEAIDVDVSIHARVLRVGEHSERNHQGLNNTLIDGSARWLGWAMGH